MYSFSTYLFLIIGAAISQNIVLAKGIYVKMPQHETNTAGKVNINGFISVIISVVASVTTWLALYINDGLLHLTNWTLPAFSVAFYALCILLLCGIYYGFIAPITHSAKKINSSVVFGFLPIAVIITTATENLPILDALCYGLGSGIGVWLLLIFNHFIQIRLDESEVPTYFRGAPITILTMGIISMAIFGLLGHGITL